MANVRSGAARTLARPRVASLLVAALAASALSVAGPGGAARAGAAASSQIAPVAIVAPVPADAAANPRSSFLGVACAGTNACLAVGDYSTASGATVPAVAQTVNGTAVDPTRAPLPAGAAANPAASLRAASCWAPGSCLAVGSYASSTGQVLGLAVGVAAGAPTAIPSPPLPAGAAADPRVSLAAVSCGGGELCSVAGTFVTRAGASDAVVARRSGNAWLDARTLPMPAGHRANPGASVEGASCWAPGDCAVVGTYVTRTGALEAYVATTTNGVPSGTVAVGIHGRSTVSVGGIACTGPGACLVTLAAHAPGAPIVPWALRGAGSSWVDTALSLPAGHRATGQIATVGAVTCASASMCVATGSYLTATGARLGFTAEQVAGAWPTAMAVPVPTGVASSRLVLLGASCTAARACTAVGQVTAASSAAYAVTAAAYLAPGAPTGLTVAQGAGRSATLSWSAPSVTGAGVAAYLVWRAQGAGAPVLLGTSPTSSFTDHGGLQLHVRYTYEVAAYADDHQLSARAAVALVTFPPASAPTSVSATAAKSAVVVRWGPPANDGGNAVRQYVLTITWSGASETVTVSGSARGATVGSLPSHVRVTVRVAAVTEAGPGTPSAPVTAVPS